MLARLRRLWHAGREAAAAYSRNLCPQLAAAIAYRVLFSLFPLAIFLVSIFGLLIENDGASRRDRHLDRRQPAPLAAGSVRLDEAVAGLGEPTSAVGLIALLGVLWAASGMMGRSASHSRTSGAPSADARGVARLSISCSFSSPASCCWSPSG